MDGEISIHKQGNYMGRNKYSTVATAYYCCDAVRYSNAVEVYTVL
jgi:hypothetical protein